MAQIRKEDIIENGLFNNTIENSKELLKLLNALDAEFVKVSKSAKTIGGELDMKDVKDVEQFLSLHKSLSTQFKESNRVLKERENIQRQLKQSTDEEVKGKLRLQKVNKDQRDALRNEIVLTDKLAGTEEKLLASNKKLRLERKRLNRSEEHTSELQSRL